MEKRKKRKGLGVKKELDESREARSRRKKETSSATKPGEAFAYLFTSLVTSYAGP
jgi:hypothetical protein